VKLRGFVLGRKLCNGRAGMWFASEADGFAARAMFQPETMTARPPASPPATHPQAILDQARALEAEGRLEAAIAALEEGLRRFPAADGFRVAVGHLHLQRNDRAAARAAFEHVRAAAPGRQDAMAGLAQVLMREGDHRAAAVLLRQALAIRPDNAGARIALGKCLLELGEREAGEAELRQVAREAPALAGPVISALAAAPRGRLFLRPSAAKAFLKA
jgi:tetratricopeptide (TPR) repeat protein